MKKLTLVSSIIITLMAISTSASSQEAPYNPYTDPDNVLYDESATDPVPVESSCTEANPCFGENISNGGFYTTTFPSEQFLGRFELAEAMGIEDAAFNDIDSGLQWLNMDAFLIPGTTTEQELSYIASRNSYFRAPTAEEFLALINNMTVSGSDPYIYSDYFTYGDFNYFDDGLTAQLAQYLFSGSNYTYDNADIFFIGPNGMEMSVYQGSLNDPIYFSAGLYNDGGYTPPNALSMLVRTMPAPSEPGGVPSYGVSDPVYNSSDLGGSQSIDVNAPFALGTLAMVGLSSLRRRRHK